MAPERTRRTDPTATRTVRLRRNGILFDVETPVVESRFIPNFRETSTDAPGLVLTDDGTVYLVLPDGSRVALTGGGGGGSWPTFTQLDVPVDPAAGDTWVRPVPEETGGGYPNQYGVGAFFWNQAADSGTGEWQQIAPVALDDDGVFLGGVTVGETGNVVIRANIDTDHFAGEVFVFNNGVNLYASDGESSSSSIITAHDSISLAADGNDGPINLYGHVVIAQGADDESATLYITQGSGSYSDGDPIVQAVSGVEDGQLVFMLEKNGRIVATPVRDSGSDGLAIQYDDVQGMALSVGLDSGGTLVRLPATTGFAVTNAIGGSGNPLEIFVTGEGGNPATVLIGGSTDRIGFFSTTPVVQPTVSDATAAAIITALASLGLIIDGT